jgi:hypothetical protein
MRPNFGTGCERKIDRKTAEYLTIFHILGIFDKGDIVSSLTGVILFFQVSGSGIACPRSGDSLSWGTSGLDIGS